MLNMFMKPSVSRHSYTPGSRHSYTPGSVYKIISGPLYVFPSSDADGKPYFSEGYMIRPELMESIPTLLCMQIIDKYIQFLYNEKIIWIYCLDADACVRPIATEQDQTK